MKRILAVLLVVSMLCVAFPVTIAATSATPTLTVSSVEGSVGDTVAVTVSIENNPGVVSMYLQLSYDAASLELVSVTDHELLPDPIFGQTMTSPYALQWDGSLLEENITDNGTLVTLNFKILDAAALGDQAITLTNVGGIMNAGLQLVDFAINNGKVTVVESVPVSTITTASISLSDNITVKYFATLDPAHVGAQMKFTMNDEEVYVDGVATGKTNQYMYAFQGVAPQCMGDNIAADLMLNGEVLASKPTNSVLTYCQRLLSYTAAQLGVTEAKYAAMETVIADLLEYGAKAQIYKNYKTDALVNEGVTGQTEFQELTTTHKQLTASTMSGVSFKGASVFFDYVNSLYIQCYATDMTENSFYVLATNTETGATAKYTLSDCVSSDGYYSLTMNPVNATYFDDCYKIELYVKDSSTGTFTSVQTLYYSIMSYVYGQQNKTDTSENLTAMAELARATYNYGLSATAYINA